MDRNHNPLDPQEIQTVVGLLRRAAKSTGDMITRAAEVILALQGRLRQLDEQHLKDAKLICSQTARIEALEADNKQKGERIQEITKLLGEIRPHFNTQIPNPKGAKVDLNVISQ